MKEKLYEVTEVCPHCESENTLIWNEELDGYTAFCPHCGKKMMLCSICPERNTGCDWCKETGCKMMKKKDYDILLTRTQVAHIKISAYSEPMAKGIVDGKGEEKLDKLDWNTIGIQYKVQK